MAIGPQYRSLATAAILQGANFQQWQKSGETDKIFLLLYDQIANRTSSLTRTQRAQAMTKYLGIKRSIADTSWFEHAPGDVRARYRDYSLNNALVEYDEGQFGLTGRFHRVLTTLVNELTNNGGAGSTEAVFRIWCNQAVRGMGEGLNFNVPPFVTEFTGYRIDTGPLIENTGADIEVDEGQRVRFYSQAINFANQIWQKDTVNITGEVTDVLNIASAVIADTGVYRNSYTNVDGTSYSDDFNLVVT